MTKLIYTYLIYQMDIEFIQLQHRKDVISLAEICGINLEQAYGLYHQYNCNIQSAISFKLGLISPSNYRSHSEDHRQQHSLDQINASFDDQFDQPYQKYRQFVESKQTFQKKYPIQIKENQVKKQINPEQNVNFRVDLQNKINSKVELKILSGGIEEGLIWSWKQSFPIALLIINYKEQSIKELCPIVNNKDIAKQINTFFRVYAINIHEKTLPKWFNNFVDIALDSNSLAVIRVNYIDQIEVESKIKFGQLDDFKKKIIRSKSQSIQKYMEEKHIIKQYILISEGKRYVRPKSIKEKLKIRQDAKLRKQQDREFHQMFKQKKQIQKIKQQKKSISPLELKKQREGKRQLMKIYSQGINLKIRVPCGKTFQIKVDPSECVQYLFDYVSSQSEDIGFESDQNRVFDILNGNKKQSLMPNIKNSIKDVLEEYELLYVKEMS